MLAALQGKVVMTPVSLKICQIDQIIVGQNWFQDKPIFVPFGVHLYIFIAAPPPFLSGNCSVAFIDFEYTLGKRKIWV